MAETEVEDANAAGAENSETQGEISTHPAAHYVPPNERAEGPGEGERGEEPT